MNASKCILFLFVWLLGRLCIEVSPADKIAFISEELCIGCGICSKVCIFLCFRLFAIALSETFCVLNINPFRNYIQTSLQNYYIITMSKTLMIIIIRLSSFIVPKSIESKWLSRLTLSLPVTCICINYSTVFNDTLVVEGWNNFSYCIYSTSYFVCWFDWKQCIRAITSAETYWNRNIYACPLWLNIVWSKNSLWFNISGCLLPNILKPGFFSNFLILVFWVRPYLFICKQIKSQYIWHLTWWVVARTIKEFEFFKYNCLPKLIYIYFLLQQKCPFEAITIINLPSNLEKDTTHRYSANSFKLHRLPTPRPGEVLGLVGTNGIGKSTALKILAGKQKPNLGKFTVKYTTFHFDDFIELRNLTWWKFVSFFSLRHLTIFVFIIFVFIIIIVIFLTSIFFQV